MKWEATDTDRRTATEVVSEIHMDALVEKSVPSGCTYDGYNLVIEKVGCYALFGEKDSCRIIIDVYDGEMVQLLLNGVHSTAKENPVIYVTNVNKVILTAVENTVNVLSDGTEYADDREAM